MAKIPLRAYIKEIENLIERGEIEPAIAHARNILRAYPKNIETYRLLGKAYLESQRYSEAADILQRVLSVIPDDFISQIGMSIIREDEGNMDAAIWHMERAYEVQPFNPAVQDELRRLYGRRDGVEPPKIRLTRGALVRMYTRGELYPQAIAETRAALAEDPQRFDLRVLLARLYNQTGQKNDAAEVCSELIAKLPYCYEANRLLAEILPTTSRADEAQKFLQRIYALNPYEAFISPSAPTSAQVPDQSVMVEEFVWDADAEATQAPGWARTVGAAWDESEPEEALPDWLNTLKPESVEPPTATQSAEVETLEPEPEAEQPAATGAMVYGDETESADLVPDWMKEAGWSSTDRSADDIMAEQLEEAGEAEIAPAEIPDWLQSIAPTEAENVEEERTGWLESILPPSDAAEKPEPEEGILAAGEEITAEEMEAFAAELNESPEQDKDQAVPEWLAGLEGEGQASSGDEIPDWLSEGEIQLPAEAAGEVESSLAPESKPVSEVSSQVEGTVEGASGEEIPDWLKTLESESADTTAEVPEWSASAETGTEEAQASGEEDALAGELPDWLQSLKEESAQPSAESQPVSFEEDLTGDILGELPSAEAGSTFEPEVPDEQPPAAVVETAEAFESAISETPAVLDSALETPVTEMDSALENVEQEIVSTETGASDITQPAMEGAAPDFTDMDATMAWLEALAARQGADEATLITPPDQRTEEMPEWLQAEAEKTTDLSGSVEPGIEGEAAYAEASAEPVETDTSSTEIAAKDEEIAFPEVTVLAQNETEESPTEETGQAIPGWLSAETEVEEFTRPEPGLTIPEGEALEDMFAADETVTEQSTEPAAEAEATATESVTPEFNLDDAMAWLESLAARQGADEATLTTSPEDRTETPPEWLQEIQEQAVQPEAKPGEEQAVAEIFEEPLASADEVADDNVLPDWLKDTAELTGEAPITFEGEPVSAAEMEESAEQVPSQEETPGISEEVPEWLAAESGEASSEAVPAQEEEAIPEWLKGLEEETEAVSSVESLAADSTDYHTAWEPEGAHEEAYTTQPERGAEVLASSSMVDLRKAIDIGDLDRAVEGYNQLIAKNENLQDVINDLHDALYRYPVDTSLWQTLGDAYARNDQLQEALDAYTKAEELLR